MSRASKSVCIIGAGAAGICAARRCLAAGHTIQVFEQCSELGGTWVYSDKVGVHSSMYENMITNLPKEVMNFRDFPFSEAGSSFMGHSRVLKYLHDYAMAVKKHIQYSTTVISVRRSSANSSWEVTISQNQKTTIKNFDVIFVCNGHFSVPRLPSWTSKLSIPWLHSHNYRRASDFKDKIIAVIGAGASGQDIALQISQYAKIVYLCHNAYQTTKVQLPSSIKIVPGVSDATSSTLILKDNSILSDLDTIVFCTGYRYTYPFFDETLIQTPEDESYVSPLFAHVAHVDYPESLFFIGLNLIIVPFILFDYQMDLALALMDENTVEKIGKNEIKNYEKKRLEAMKAANVDPRRYHVLGDSQWDYYRELCAYSGQPYRTPEVVQKLYNLVSKERSTIVAEYKNHNYKVIDENNFEKFVLDPNSLSKI